MNSVIHEIILVFKKEILTATRFKGTWLTMLMFSVTTLSLISLTLKGTLIDGATLSALFWIIIFFSATTSVDRLFIEEEFSGTIRLLKLCGASYSVLFGKMLYGFVLLFALSIFTTLLFFILLDANLAPDMAIIFLTVLILGVTGLSVSGTFLAALSASAKVKSGLFPVLMLPVMLPIMLPGAEITAIIFDGGGESFSALTPMVLYNLILITVSSILFDYVWYEDL